MPIRKHGRGWEVRLQHGGRRYSKTVATRSDAQYLEARIRQRLNDSRAERTPVYSLEEALARWIANESKGLKSQRTVRTLVKQVLPDIRGRSLHEAPAVAEQIIRKGREAGAVAATINRRIALVKRLAKLAYKRWGWLENDLGAKIELLPGEVKRTVYVTPAEGKRLMAAARPDIREAIRWALLTGLRRGEMLALTPIHFRDRAIHLTDTKSGRPRSVPIPAELDPKRFPFDLHPTALSKGFQAARRLARMPQVRFHDLRRSYGTWLVQKGVDVGAVRDLLGHSTVAMTDRYLGVSQAHRLRAIVRKLPALGRTRGRNGVSHRQR